MIAFIAGLMIGASIGLILACTLIVSGKQPAASSYGLRLTARCLRLIGGRNGTDATQL